MTKVLVLYYSRDNSVKTLAQHIVRGIDSIDGVESVLRTVPEVSPTTESTDKPVPDSGAPYVTHDDLKTCDGLVLGSPTRFGNMSAAMKYFWDTTTGIWLSGSLIGKPAGVFTSTGSLHGGQETTLMSMMIPLLHHGMIIAGVPYSEPGLGTTSGGGTPYGPTHVSGADGKKPFIDEEKALAIALGKRIATLAQCLANKGNR